MDPNIGKNSSADTRLGERIERVEGELPKERKTEGANKRTLNEGVKAANKKVEVTFLDIVNRGSGLLLAVFAYYYHATVHVTATRRRHP